MSDNCNDCTPTPCVDCQGVELALTGLCQEGCEKYIPTDCGIYSGPDITNENVTITNGMSLTDVIAQLSNNALDVDVALSFNPSSRVLSLLKNDSSVSTVTIVDRDDQYLALDENILSIWKPRYTGDIEDDIKINEVDLSELVTETTLVISSDSLVVTPAGTNGHTPTIELVPSEDDGNILVMGTDGHPFVPETEVPILDVIIPNISGLSWTRSLIDGVLTLTPSFDFTYIASQVCAICNPTCTAPSNLNVTSI